MLNLICQDYSGLILLVFCISFFGFFGVIVVQDEILNNYLKEGRPDLYEKFLGTGFVRRGHENDTEGLFAVLVARKFNHFIRANIHDIDIDAVKGLYKGYMRLLIGSATLLGLSIFLVLTCML